MKKIVKTPDQDIYYSDLTGEEIQGQVFVGDMTFMKLEQVNSMPNGKHFASLDEAIEYLKKQYESI